MYSSELYWWYCKILLFHTIYMPHFSYFIFQCLYKKITIRHIYIWFLSSLRINWKNSTTLWCSFNIIIDSTQYCRRFNVFIMAYGLVLSTMQCIIPLALGIINKHYKITPLSTCSLYQHFKPYYYWVSFSFVHHHHHHHHHHHCHSFVQDVWNMRNVIRLTFFTRQLQLLMPYKEQ
jgi:hypothetical protein